MSSEPPIQAIPESESPSILSRTWRYIPFKKYDPLQVIALSDVALSSVNKTGSPVIWLYGVTRSAVTVGNNQRISDVVDISAARRLHIDIVRRTGDGGAVYLDTAGEISWAAILPNELLPPAMDQIVQSYAEKVVAALATLQIEAYFKPPNDIVTTLGKISVLSMKRERYATMINGTLLYAVNTAIIQSVLTPENDKTKSRKVPERLRPITSVSLEAEKTKEDTIQALSESLLNKQTFKIDDWSNAELSDAQILAEKYGSKEWLRLD